MMGFRFFASAAGAAVALALVASSTAFAEDCNQDLANLSKKRQSVIDQLNHLAKGPKGQLDPIASCPKLRSLVAAERDLVAYVTKNKEWCMIPDQAVENISGSMSKSSAIANQACTIAVQMKKAQEQQAAGGLTQQGQRLPTGPL